MQIAGSGSGASDPGVLVSRWWPCLPTRWSCQLTSTSAASRLTFAHRSPRTSPKRRPRTSISTYPVYTGSLSARADSRNWHASVTDHALTLRTRPAGSRTMVATFRLISSSSLTAWVKAARSVARTSLTVRGDTNCPQHLPKPVAEHLRDVGSRVRLAGDDRVHGSWVLLPW